MSYVEQLKKSVSDWSGVSVRDHRFGGTEFCFGNAEIGHTHPGGILDLPMPRPIHDALLEAGLAEQHRWAPGSGWITFRIHDDRGLQHALSLLRLSYLRYALKKSDDPQALFEGEIRNLALPQRIVDLLGRFVHVRA